MYEYINVHNKVEDKREDKLYYILHNVREVINLKIYIN